MTSEFVTVYVMTSCIQCKNHTFGTFSHDSWSWILAAPLIDITKNNSVICLFNIFWSHWANRELLFDAKTISYKLCQQKKICLITKNKFETSVEEKLSIEEHK